jgi:cytochrome oxidase Cu insertion factor (SCO1/SenC/PrrC family)
MVSKKYGKFSLNFDRFIKAKTQEIIEAINEALEHIQQRINEKTPEDTGDLVDHNVIVKAVEKDGVITGSVKNSLGYAIYVEYGRSKTE